jgi:antitoxin MazE
VLLEPFALSLSKGFDRLSSNGISSALTPHQPGAADGEGKTMEVAIRKMGNSQGVLIPKPILAQVGLEGSADLQVRNGVIEIRPVRRNPREGWAEDARRLAEQSDDTSVWPEFANEGDDKLVW